MYWKTGDGKIYFDGKIKPTSKVQVVNNYNTYKLENGGWAAANYQAPINVRINNNQYVSIKETLSMENFGNFPLPDFNHRNSNYIKALAAYNSLVPYMNGFTDRANQQDQYAITLSPTSSSITEMFRRIEAFRASIYPEIQSKISVPAISVAFKRALPTSNDNDTLKVTITANATDGKFTVSPQLDKYDHIEVDIIGVPIQNQGSYTHAQIEDVLESVNSGLSAGLSRIQQSNILKMGIRKGTPVHTTPFQSVASKAQDGSWYDSLKSTLDYSLVESNDHNGYSLPYTTCVTEVPQLSQVWVGGINGLLSIDVYTYKVMPVNLPVNVKYEVKSIYTDEILVYILTSEGLFIVDGNGSITKDVELDLPNDTSSLILVRESYIVATPTGLYTKKSYETSWKKILDIKDAFISATSSFIFCAGKDPNSITDTLSFSSVDGLSWSSRTVIPNTYVNSVARSSYLIFFATTSGLYIEDLSRLLDPSNDLPIIEMIDLMNDLEVSAALNFNDICADNTRVVAALSDGSYWIYQNGEYTQSGVDIGVIHKIRLINGKVWAFGKNMVQVEDNSRLIRLATGASLL
jgi:hypothetical protein